MMKLRLLQGFSLFTFAILLCLPVFAQEAYQEEGEALFGDIKIESASKYSQSLNEIPATVTVVTSDTIEKMGFKTFADVLNFYSVSFATFSERRYEFAIERGLYEFDDYNTRLLILVDGHIMNEPSNNFAGLDRSTPVPLEIVDRIEIIYGPFGVLYGTSNLGGVINIVTKKTGSIPKFYSKVSYGSFNSIEILTCTKFSTHIGSLPFDGYFSASSYDSDGIKSGLPRTRLNPDDAWYGSLNWDYTPVYGGSWEKRTDFERAPSLFGKFTLGELTLTAFWGYRKKGEPYAPWGDVYGENSNWVKDERSAVVASFTHHFTPAFSLSSKVAYDDYSYFENDTYADNSFFPGSIGYFWQDSMKTRRISAEVSGLWTLNRSNYIVGAYHRKEKLFEIVSDEPVSDSGQTFFERGGSLRQSASAFYTMGEWNTFNNSRLSASLNYVKHNFTKGELLYRASFIYPFSTKTVLKAVYGRGFRTPSYYEYAYHDSMSDLNNPLLKSEKSPALELSLSITPSLSQNYVFAVFKQDISGFITPLVIQDPSQIQGDVIPAGADPNDYIGFRQFQNQGDVHIKGASFSGRWTAKKGMSLYSNLSYSDVKEKYQFSKGRKNGSPRMTGNLGLLYENEDIFASFALSYIGNFLTSEAHSIPPYKIGSSWDSRLNVGIKNFLDPSLKLTFTIVNPLNSSGKVPLSPDFIPAVGKRNDRMAIVSIAYQY
jgi:outer membrane receptor for ferrienterochelin and colicins